MPGGARAGLCAAMGADRAAGRAGGLRRVHRPALPSAGVRGPRRAAGARVRAGAAQ